MLNLQAKVQGQNPRVQKKNNYMMNAIFTYINIPDFRCESEIYKSGIS